MRKGLILILLAVTICVAVWRATGLFWEPLDESVSAGKFGSTELLANSASDSRAQGDRSIDNEPATDSLETNLKRVDELLNNKRYADAVQALDEIYAQLSSADLERFKLLFLNAATRLSRAQNNHQAAELLTHYTASYDDTDAWNQLGNVQMLLQDWQPALSAFMRSSALEYRPDELVRKLSALVQTSSYVRTALEKQGDEPAIQQMYQSLYQLHPNYTRFQLELAQSHLRLQQIEQAARLFELLLYDPELGEIARQNLDRINASPAAGLPTDGPQSTAKRELVVPLNRIGNSFLLEVSIGSSRLPLLLDTGASITALSKDVIRRLGLRPTGNYIQLNTANGQRRSQLFQTGEIRVGSLVKESFVVAEIDLAKSAAQGLLGTDLLNQLDPAYSYVIDNQKNVLIFRSR